MEFREYSHIPNYKFSSRKFHSFSRLGGPCVDSFDTICDPNDNVFVSCKSFSTLPKGDNALTIRPVSHRFYCSFYGDKVLFGLSDGGLGGSTNVEAAERALVGFIDYMHGIQSSFDTTREAAHALQRSFARAHSYISEGKNDSSTCGTAQLLGGMVIKLQKGAKHSWAFVCCSVGHCKAFCLKNDKTLVDITQNNYLYRVSTPLGRLGPCIEGTYPDLSNLRLYYYPLSENDKILITTSGIHANFHPQQLGKTPKQLNFPIDNWKELSSNDKGKDLLNTLLCEEMKKVLVPNNSIPSINEILTNIGNHIMEMTKSARDYIEDNNSTLDNLPIDKFPALIDHCTSFIFNVEELKMLKLAKIEDIGISPKVTNRQWKWHCLIPENTENANPFNFNIFEYLCTKNPSMKTIIDSQKEESYERAYININNPDIELYQNEPSKININVRSKNSPDLFIEKWEDAGIINLEKKPKNKSAIGNAFSNLLRQKEVDRRTVTEAVDSIMNLNTLANVFTIIGTRKILNFEVFGSIFKIISGDMIISQSDITITSVGGEAKGKHRFIEISSKKETSIVNFLENIPKNNDWITCGMSEFLFTIEEPTESDK